MAPLPAPMQAPEALRSAFTDPDWLMEIKYDGYRALAGVEAGAVRLQTKSGADCSSWFPEIAQALAAISGGPTIMDGEVCVLRPDGTSDFNALQERARHKHKRRTPPVTYCVFDLLVFDGHDVMHWPLEDRKVLLQLVLLDAGLMVVDSPEESPRFPHHVLFVDDLPANADLFHAMVQAGLAIEGVVAKRRDSIYRPGVRSSAWAKIKRGGWLDAHNWRG